MAVSTVQELYDYLLTVDTCQDGLDWVAARTGLTLEQLFQEFADDDNLGEGWISHNFRRFLEDDVIELPLLWNTFGKRLLKNASPPVMIEVYKTLQDLVPNGKFSRHYLQLIATRFRQATGNYIEVIANG